MHNMPVRKKLSDEVRLRLEEMIRDEVYPVGASLPSERELAKHLALSRATITTALTMAAEARSSDTG